MVVLHTSDAIAALEPKVKGQIEDEQTGMAIVKRALEELVASSHKTQVMTVLSWSRRSKKAKLIFGFNARTEVFENLFKAGVIDPTQGKSRVALKNAASIAGMLLTTECVVAEKPKEEAPHTHGAPIRVEWVTNIKVLIECKGFFTGAFLLPNKLT